MTGSASLSVNFNTNNIEDVSTFNNESFIIVNTGTKDITSIEIDVSNALFPDAVFDPFGVAGDTLAKILTPVSETADATGLVTPSGGFGTSAVGITYLGAGGTAGFERIRLEFTNFTPGKTFSFGLDMDPNSVAGAPKHPLEAASPVPGAGGDNEWHVGAISGAELIGSTFAVTYTDGTSSLGQLMGQGNDAVSGSIAYADQSSPNHEVILKVNGLEAGGSGSYNDGGPTVTVQGPAGQTARIALAKGIQTPFSNPFTDAYGAQFQAQHDALATSAFPANNAVEMQYIDVTLDGSIQDVNTLFDFEQVTENFQFPFPENELPLAFSASVIDAVTDFSLGPVTSPIHLVYKNTLAKPPVVNILNTGSEIVAEGAIAQVSIATDLVVPSDEIVSINFTISPLGGATAGVDFEPLASGTDAINNGTYTGTQDISGSSQILSIPISVLDDLEVDPGEGFQFTVNSVSPNATLGANNTAIFRIEDNDSSVPVPGTVVRAINAGGTSVTQDTVVYEADTLFIGGNSYKDGWFKDSTSNQTVFDGTISEAERFGDDFSYQIDVAQGVYDVDLNFAEIYFDQVGDRVFDVLVEGQTVLDDFDILAANGGDPNAAITETIVGVDSATYGAADKIEIQFISSVNNAKISGIVIRQGDPIDSLAGAAESLDLMTPMDGVATIADLSEF